MKASVNNHAEISNAKENTDTESSGVKMSIGEKLETKVVVGAIKDNIDKISKEEVFDNRIGQIRGKKHNCSWIWQN